MIVYVRLHANLLLSVVRGYIGSKIATRTRFPPASAREPMRVNEDGTDLKGR